MKILSITVLTVLLVASCSENKLADFSKLKGTWVYSSPEGKYVETWNEEKDGKIEGFSCSLYGKDTLFTEKLKIELKNGTVVYVPLLTSQNKGKEVIFKLKSKTENEWIFSNPRHDFPQEIVYTFKGKDSLVAVLRGKESGTFQSIPFPMRREK